MKPQRAAFSLVELSIVLVILGLLVGGVLAGKSLIRASELRAVGSEYSGFVTATQAFRDKYFSLPGDMASATSFWGVSTACSGGSASGTCNGNGDAMLNPAGGASQTGEYFQFWTHLALAGLVEGAYTGVAGSAANSHSIPGTNIPRSKLSDAAWGVRYWGIGSQLSNGPAIDAGNVFSIGGAIGNNYPEYPSTFKPEEAWNIDTKLDDGMPFTGITLVRSYDGIGGSGNCSTASSSTDYASTYRLNNTLQRCSLYFRRSY